MEGSEVGIFTSGVTNIINAIIKITTDGERSVIGYGQESGYGNIQNSSIQITLGAIAVVQNPGDNVAVNLRHSVINMSGTAATLAGMGAQDSGVFGLTMGGGLINDDGTTLCNGSHANCNF